MRKLVYLLLLLSVVGCASRQSVGLKSQKAAETQVLFNGGSGESLEDAVIINGVTRQSDGVDAEYEYVARKHGVRGRDWRLTGQTIVQDHGKVFDVLEIALLLTKEQRIYYFDVTAFPWKKK